MLPTQKIDAVNGGDVGAGAEVDQVIDERVLIIDPESQQAQDSFYAIERVPLDTKVDSLVEAMAGFAPPRAGQMTLPQQYANASTPILVANP